MTSIDDTLRSIAAGRAPSRDEALALAGCDDLPRLTSLASELTRAGHGTHVSFSKKVFIPLTQLCRDACGYCTFAHGPRAGEPAYLSLEAVLDIARKGKAAGCKEALFTLGDKPELRYRTAREALARLGHDSTLSYLESAASAVLKETGLLPHLNPGSLDDAWLARLRKVSVSSGIMLESTAARLTERGGAHEGAPDKDPALRLETLEAAGRAAVPFTTGILIGIGETRAERIDALLAIRDVHARHGHIQEVIVQNFRAKPGTRMAAQAEPDLADHVWTIAIARLILGPAMNIQAPPNLQPDGLAQLVSAGINDWGGVSPVTPDHVNPEAPWPHLDALEAATERAGRTLVQRLAVYPSYATEPKRWIAPELCTPLLHHMDGAGYARDDAWCSGGDAPLPTKLLARMSSSPLEGAGVGGRRHAESAGEFPLILARARDGVALSQDDVVALFGARGRDFTAVCRAADDMRRELCGDVVTYVVNRNINYTNICNYGCKFCAFSKGSHSLGNREKPYDLDFNEIAGRTREAASRGATEVCLQGGIRPGYTGDTYLGITRAVKAAVPDMHVHAFSPLEVTHGARTLGLPLRDFLSRLKDAGLGSLPGTAAEILDDEIRATLCPDKIRTDEWLDVMRTAHGVGLKTTATIMFGHIEGYRNWARHLIRVRDLAAETGGFTEMVPLPFVHMEAPIYMKGQARKGPTFREAVLMHAISRLVFGRLIPNIQASWVKLGPDGAAACLDAGVNDLGGVLMNESISRSAGAVHGQEMSADDLCRLIESRGRTPRRRTTLYKLFEEQPARPVAAE